ncbi:hypothetical protein CUMW_240140 [Citrus unshiu]|nr:hypothetical protein CUMW_240140 [Citrus unshiu]
MSLVSPMQQPLEMLVNLCGIENDTLPLKMPDDCASTKRDPIIISTQGKDYRLVYNLRKRRDRKTSTFLRTRYTNSLKKPRETSDVEAHPLETVDFEVHPHIPQEELLELQRWMDIVNDKKNRAIQLIGDKIELQDGV